MPDVFFAIPAAPVVVPALLITVLMASASLQQRRQLTPARLLTVLAASAYGAALVAVTLFPFRIALGAFASPLHWYEKINLIPLVTADPAGFLLNIFMTIPLGLLVPLLIRVRSVGTAALIGFGVSATIEVTQGICSVLFSGGRTADVNDLIANTGGAAIGYLLLQRLRSVHSGRLVERLTLEPASR